MKNKQYKKSENTPATLHEPAVTYLTKSTSPPCSMTIDELKNEVRQSVKDAQNGLHITLEQARNRHPRLK